jgi:hypothetical protein
MIGANMINKVTKLKITKLAFLKWLVTRDNSETYHYTDNEDCFIARFLQDLFPNTPISVGRARLRLYPAECREIQVLFYDDFMWLGDVSVAARNAYLEDNDFHVLGIRDRLEREGFFNSLDR